MADAVACEMAVTPASGRLALTGGTPEFRRDLAIMLSGSGLGASRAVLRLYYRGTCVALFEDWSVDGEDLVATDTLNTAELEAAFDGRASDAIIPLTAKLFDAVTEEAVAEGRIPCRNNPPGAYDDPTELPQLVGTGVAVRTEVFTLAAADIAAKQITLGGEPSGSFVEALPHDGPQGVKDTDFRMLTGRKLSWDGLGWDGLLVAGDQLTVAYSYQPA